MNKIGAVLSGRIRDELSELAGVVDRAEQGWGTPVDQLSESHRHRGRQTKNLRHFVDKYGDTVSYSDIHATRYLPRRAGIFFESPVPIRKNIVKTLAYLAPWRFKKYSAIRVTCPTSRVPFGLSSGSKTVEACGSIPKIKHKNALCS